MIDHSHSLPVVRQAKVLGISRGSVYYLPRPVPAADLAIMRRMDELHLEYPFAGSRMLRDLLRQEGTQIGRQHVATLMKRMAIEAIYRRPNTSRPTTGHKIYPYLLRCRHRGPHPDRHGRAPSRSSRADSTPPRWPRWRRCRGMRIPRRCRPPFRGIPARDSELIPPTIPINSRPPWRWPSLIV